MMACSSSSVVAPTVIRVPSYNRMSSDSLLSTVLPPLSARTPQELLPVIPPRGRRLGAAGGGGEGQDVFCAGAAQPVEPAPRLDAGELLRRVEHQNRVHIFREAHDHG